MEDSGRPKKLADLKNPAQPDRGPVKCLLTGLFPVLHFYSGTLPV